MSRSRSSCCCRCTQHNITRCVSKPSHSVHERVRYRVTTFSCARGINSSRSNIILVKESNKCPLSANTSVKSKRRYLWGNRCSAAPPLPQFLCTCWPCERELTKLSVRELFASLDVVLFPVPSCWYRNKFSKCKAFLFFGLPTVLIPVHSIYTIYSICRQNVSIFKLKTYFLQVFWLPENFK